MIKPGDKVRDPMGNLGVVIVVEGKWASVQWPRDHVGTTRRVLKAGLVPQYDGTEGQDRESYSDDQDRDSYGTGDDEE